jgi:caffeoyl-CoA O-methyltransferase
VIEHWIQPGIVRYATEHSSPCSAVLDWISDQTKLRTGSDARMRIPKAQATFLSMLTRLVNPTVAIEIGTFTGSSSVAIATSLQPNATLTCFDNSQQWTAIAEQAWERAGVRSQVELRHGDALNELAEYLPGKTVDFAFIDANKTQYGLYFQAIANVLSPTGMIVVDNTIWSGRVLDELVGDPDTVAVREFNKARRDDSRFDVSMLTIGDGLTLIRPRALLTKGATHATRTP